MNPITTLHVTNGRKIVIRLLPESASNIVSSSIYIVPRGYLDRRVTERIVPGNWVDVSYTAFGRKEYRYLIPNEFELNPDVKPLDSYPGSICTGGRDEARLASCEFFFSLRDCPDHKGIYPVFSRILEGVGEVYRLEKIETVSVIDFSTEGVEVNRLVRPEIIKRVEPELYGAVHPEPMRARGPELPGCWKDKAAE